MSNLAYRQAGQAQSSKPQRTCAICRAKKEKKELFRFTCPERVEGLKDGGVLFDKEQKISARGFYICGKECWEMARKKKRKIKYNSVAKPAKMVLLPDKGFEEMVEK
ncbi:YlxR family protein [Candidatus Microgenomates bacterium]|nr:YlxR family protein [Candidatus Microgenomates bacterium]